MPQNASRELLTERLRITPFRISDTPLFHAYRNEPETARYQSWSVPYARKDADDFVLWAIDATLDEFSGSCQFAIRLRESEQLIGDIAVLGDLTNGRQAMLGYTLAQRYQGNGYAFEACSVMLTMRFANGKCIVLLPTLTRGTLHQSASWSGSDFASRATCLSAILTRMAAGSTATSMQSCRASG